VPCGADSPGGGVYHAPIHRMGSRLLPRRLRLVLSLAVPLAACGPDYSPDTYATRAVQQANKVEQGVIVGVRQVQLSVDGTVGAATGAAAGGVAGAQTGGGNMTAALGAIGGALVGGVIGSTVERAGGDTTAFEYIVRKENGELFSVAQRDTTPLPLGQRVLMITGNQARIVPDYTAPSAPPPSSAPPPVEQAPLAAPPAPAAPPAGPPETP